MSFFSALLRNKHRPLIMWAVCCLLAGIVFAAYTSASLAAGHGEFIMPLDDVYIHFQYARQIANGQPYLYNPGLPPTSGATSFLYPYILAAGYILGFQGLNLGLWAMIVGALALAGSGWLVYRLGVALYVPGWLALWVALTFALTGSLSWHFMSGMETGLMVLFVLLTLYIVVGRSRVEWAAVSASLLALTRPEGSLLALIAIPAIFWQRRSRNTILWLILPLAAMLAQPAVNWLLTGSASASGNQAKSLLGMIPFDWNVILGRILENFTQIWQELATGMSAREGTYLPALLPPLALVGWLWLCARRSLRPAALLILGWLLIGSSAISTLDTAFWHFKRYQMPLIALLFPLAAWGSAALWRCGEQAIRLRRIVAAACVAIVPALTLLSFGNFLVYFAANSRAVYAQPFQMARWLAANTPPEAAVAVHDVGMMRYIGDRTTIDMVGLTTSGAADYWRNGPGAVAEYLINQRPDYIAAYTEARGLSYLADTGVYGHLLAGFDFSFDARVNVALGGRFQGIYRPEWGGLVHRQEMLQPSVLGFLGNLNLAHLLMQVNVADTADEARYGYQWRNGAQLPGFATEVYEQAYIDCAVDPCQVLDGGRRINGEESFDISLLNAASSASDIILVTRLHPVNSGTISIYVGSPREEERLVATRWIPALPGRWLEIATLIPHPVLPTGEPLRIRVVPDIPGGHYMPYYHWVYTGVYNAGQPPEKPIVTYQNAAIMLAGYSVDYSAGASQLTVRLDWYGSGASQGDYLVFVHLYGDVSEPPVAQADVRPGSGTLPPGNWLPGAIRDQVVVNLAGVSPGTYQLAVGFYDPLTLSRLSPDSGGDDENRVFLQEVEITTS